MESFTLALLVTAIAISHASITPSETSTPVPGRIAGISHSAGILNSISNPNSSFEELNKDFISRHREYRVYDDENFQYRCIDKINDLRRIHENTRPLSYGYNLTHYTVKRAHSIVRDIENKREIVKGRYALGESFFWYYDLKGYRSVEDAINTWYAESRHYDYNRPSFSAKTGGFTQLVWKGSREVSCAKIEYETNEHYKTLLVCNFYPAGNVNGEFPYNVFPPKRNGGGNRPQEDDEDDYYPNRPNRPNRPSRPDRPSRPERPSRPSRPYPPSRPDQLPGGPGRPRPPYDDPDYERPNRPHRPIRPDQQYPTHPISKDTFDKPIDVVNPPKDEPEVAAKAGIALVEPAPAAAPATNLPDKSLCSIYLCPPILPTSMINTKPTQNFDESMTGFEPKQQQLSHQQQKPSIQQANTAQFAPNQPDTMYEPVQAFLVMPQYANTISNRAQV